MSRKVTITRTMALAIQMTQACAVRAYQELENRLVMHMEHDPVDFVNQDGWGERIVDGTMTFYPDGLIGDGITIDTHCEFRYEGGKLTRASVVLVRNPVTQISERREFVCTIKNGELLVEDCNPEPAKVEETPVVSRRFWQVVADFFRSKRDEAKA